MDAKQKKILTGVGVSFVVIIAIIIYKVFFTENTKNVKKITAQTTVKLPVPKVDKNYINEYKKKISVYNRENEVEKKVKEKYSDIANSMFDLTDLVKKKGGLKDYSSDKGKSSGKDRSMSKDQDLNLIQEILASQRKSQVNPVKMPDLSEMTSRYQKKAMNELEKYQNGFQVEGEAGKDGLNFATKMNGVSLMDIKANRNEEGGMSFKSYFHSVGQRKSTLELIPAETVDERLVSNGATIGIRIKKAIELQSPPIVIPKDAVVYGRVNIQPGQRVKVRVNTYKTEDMLYKINFQLYDFDGRRGIHLGNRAFKWSKIFPKVSKDVYQYGYQRGTSQSAFGGGSSIDLNEAKDLALLSTANHTTQEIFGRERVRIPKKYKLWVNIQPNAGGGGGASF